MAHSLSPIARAISNAIWNTTPPPPVAGALVEGMEATHPPAAGTRPAKGVEFIDPTYGTSIYRITDHVADLTGNVTPVPAFVRNDYSRRQAFNANDTYMMLYAFDGFWHLYDATTYAWIKRIQFGGADTEPQWHPTNPSLIRYFPNTGIGMVINELNVDTDAVTVIADLTSVVSIEGNTAQTSINDIWPTAAVAWTKTEGSPSINHQYWGMQVEAADFSPLGLIVYDLTNNLITGVYDFATDGGGMGRPDHCSMSPSGNWFVPSWHSPLDCSTVTGVQFYEVGGKGTSSNPCGLMAFNRDFTVAVSLSEIGPHSDIMIDANGDDWIVYVDYQQHAAPNDDGWIRATKLSTGETIDLIDINVSPDIIQGVHFSGKAFNKPGWFLMSTYINNNMWFDRKLIAVELAANPNIYVLAHNQWSQTDNNYFTEVHASVNRDFSRIIFNSPWGSSLVDDLETFEVKIDPTDLIGSV